MKTIVGYNRFSECKEVEKIDSRENLIRLIEQYQNLVFSICLKITGDYFTSEDLTQETFIAAFRAWDSFDGLNEKSWICRIATNKSIDYKRRAERKYIVVEEDSINEIVDYKDPAQEVLNRETMDEFENAIKRLKEPYKSIALTHFIDGKTAKEIAADTGISLKTIQTQILRARNLLKKSVRKEDLNT